MLSPVVTVVQGLALDGWHVPAVLVEIVDHLGQRVVVGVAGSPDRGVDASFDESVGERDGRVLTDRRNR